MSRGKVVSLASLAEPDELDPTVQSVHLERAADAVERILLTAYDQRHDDAARVLAEILERLRDASRFVGSR
jgi:hypothetical protein